MIVTVPQISTPADARDITSAKSALGGESSRAPDPTGDLAEPTFVLATDFGSVSEDASEILDYGLIIDPITEVIDLG